MADHLTHDTPTPPQPAPGSVDADTVRWLLSRIDDTAALSQSPLLSILPASFGSGPTARAHRLRALLLEGVEQLRPHRRLSRRAGEARAYHALWLRYVDSLSVLEVGEELNLSERQTHRELRAAEARLAEHLQALLSQNSSNGSDGDTIIARPDHVDLSALVEEAARTVSVLTTSVSVAVELEPGDSGLGLSAYVDEGILRQWLIQTLSLALQASAGPSVRVALESLPSTTEVRVSFTDSIRAYSREALAGLERLAAVLSASHEVDVTIDGHVTVALSLPKQPMRVVLVIEDNPAAVELYRRYLETSGEWSVVSSVDPRQAYELARTVQPAVILLDLLMPGTDGWTILNLLHASPETTDIPVIVCSVFHDAVLATALGAKEHLRKPVSQVELLEAVTRWAR